jgi:hypothetical protein
MVNNRIIRNKHLADKIVFVDGLPGCGKTLLSNLVSALNRVELLSYCYEIEHLASLYFLEKIEEDAVIAMTKLYTDLKLYNVMMGRDVNFRYDDLSSAFKHHNASNYFQRLFQPGDDAVIDRVAIEKPILNIATHNLFPHSLPIIKALGNRCLFLVMERHPIYMIKQQKLNMDRLLQDNPKYFTVNFDFNGRALPYFTKGWEEKFIQSTSIEKSIYYIYFELEKKRNFKKYLQENGLSGYYTLSFEDLALNPLSHLLNIAKLIDSELSTKTYDVMKMQNVPRKIVSDGINIDIYKRCGWRPLSSDSELENIGQLRKEFECDIGRDAEKVLDALVSDYESRVWSPVKGVIS